MTVPPTFLFTDIECSTRLLERLGEGYADLLATHWEVMRRCCAARGGEARKACGTWPLSASGVQCEPRLAGPSRPGDEAFAARVAEGTAAALDDGVRAALDAVR